jgi:sugar fermentation stimulation protein A
MKFISPLVPARLLRRYKRFLADVELSTGEASVAHCANPGAMLGLAHPNAKIWLSPSPNPKSKLAWRWELEDVSGVLVGINTSRPNAIVEEAIFEMRVAELMGYPVVRREVRYGANSRIDLLLERGAEKCFVEIKNVTMIRGRTAVFPDSVSARGAKHLDELAAQAAQGNRAVMIYCVQRSDAENFAIAADLDPAYAAAFARALAAGVEAYAYACAMSVEEISLSHRIPFAPGCVERCSAYIVSHDD